MDDKWSDDAPSKVYSCNNCLNPVAFSTDLLSKSFMAKSGRAAMFGSAMNVTVGEKEDRKLMTGHFTVGDIYCAKCGQVLGWKYFRAYEPRQVYKEGKYILEFAKLVKAAA
ncbi:protein yippee-like At4g27745 [Silene latifolia]|uniref:protein yippee-like At4g27745 n=1 Tax=Silene latifolia TaxID=37657 RepID=UPI003D7854D3